MNVDVGDADAVEKAYKEVVRDVRSAFFFLTIFPSPFFFFHISPISETLGKRRGCS
jgi:hypothetical protein